MPSTDQGPAIFREADLFASAEEKALALAVRPPFDDSTRTSIEQAADVCDDQALADLARRHIIAPLLYHRLNSLDLLGRIEGNARTDLKRDYGVAAMRADSMTDCLGETLSALAAAGVAAAPIKGSALAWSVYPEASLRPMADFDLLVPAGEADRAAEALASIGYRPATDDPALLAFFQGHFHLPPMTRDGAVTIELHTGTPAAPVGPAAEAVLGRASRGELAGAPMRELAPADQLAIVAASMLHHRRLRLIALLDVALLAPSLSEDMWQSFPDRVDAPYHAAAGAVLGLSREMFGAAIPESLPREMLCAAGGLKRVAGAPREVWSRRARGLALLGTTARGVGGLFPSRGATALAFGVDSRSWSFPLYRAMHPFRQALLGLSSLFTGA